jgi:hypothetical protein
MQIRDPGSALTGWRDGPGSGTVRPRLPTVPIAVGPSIWLSRSRQRHFFVSSMRGASQVMPGEPFPRKPSRPVSSLNLMGVPDLKGIAAVAVPGACVRALIRGDDALRHMVTTKQTSLNDCSWPIRVVPLA